MTFTKEVRHSFHSWYVKIIAFRDNVWVGARYALETGELDRNRAWYFSTLEQATYLMSQLPDTFVLEP